MGIQWRSKLKQIVAEVREAFNVKALVSREERELTALQHFAWFWMLVGRSFVRNRCLIRASALAYTTLLALVPLLAVAISISTAMLQTESGEQQVEDAIKKMVASFAPQLGLVPKADDTEVSGVQQVVDFINERISTIHSGTLGVTATIALIFLAISLLINIEATLNDIWGVKGGRTFMARVIQYWAAITLGPILLLVAMGLNAGPHFEWTRQLLTAMPVLGALVFQFVPILLWSLVFGAFYRVMPHTYVEWRAALVGGLATGLLLHLNNTFAMIYFGQVVRTSKIYGSLGIVPVFLIGLYFSWIIVLFGAQLAYAFQNRKAYFQERQSEIVNERGLEFVALRLMTLVAGRFHVGQPAPGALEIAELLAVPVRLINRITKPLMHSRVLVETGGKEPGYVPARPLDEISCLDVLDAIRIGSGNEVATKDDEQRAQVRETLDRIQTAERAIADEVTLEELIQQASNPTIQQSPHPHVP